MRREAVVLLGMIEDEAVLPYLYKGLNDKSPAVRRTAGDCLSDLGFKRPCQKWKNALDDPQKLSVGVLQCLYLTKEIRSNYLL